MQTALWAFLHENPSLKPSRMLYECQCVVLADDRRCLRAQVYLGHPVFPTPPHTCGIIIGVQGTPRTVNQESHLE